MQKRTLARTAWPQHSNVVAITKLQRDITQHRKRFPPSGIFLGQLIEYQLSHVAFFYLFGRARLPPSRAPVETFPFVAAWQEPRPPICCGLAGASPFHLLRLGRSLALPFVAAWQEPRPPICCGLAGASPS